ncbi:MAG: 50S ribosomal protein L6 [bacterium]
MSRIGQAVIITPDKVKVRIEGQHVAVEGPKGKLAMEMHRLIHAQLEDQKISVKRKGDSKEERALHGLTRSLIANMVKGVSDGFSKKLEIQGVGFRAVVQGKILVLSLGKSHPIHYPIFPDIKITVDNNFVLIEGVDKQRVGAAAAAIRAFYPPEPYKGKGVRYVGEHVRRKEGKTAQSK